MTAVSGKQYGVGAQYAVVFALNATGTPDASDTSPYSGVQMVGAKAFTLTIPDARKVTHIGDSRPLQVDYLPPTDAMSGELTVAQENFTLLALLTGTEVLTTGESKSVGLGTSQQGLEPQVGLLLFQQALDETGTRVYRWFLAPRATLYPHPEGFNDNPSEHRFIISPAVVTKHLWGTTFVDAAKEGFTEAQMILGQSTYRPAVVAWKASTGTTQFDLPALAPGINATKMTVWVDGVEQTSGITAGTTRITFGTAPGNGKMVVCFYER
jgi:hypothetical protein